MRFDDGRRSRDLTQTNKAGRASEKPGGPIDAKSVDLDLVIDAVHGGHQGDGHESDDHTHEDDDGRLEKTREAVDPDVDLSVVVRRSQLELLVECSGLLAYSEHLASGAREETATGDGRGQALPLDHVFAHGAEASLVHRV